MGAFKEADVDAGSQATAVPRPGRELHRVGTTRVIVQIALNGNEPSSVLEEEVLRWRGHTLVETDEVPSGPLQPRRVRP